jgi:hypothetical protein
MVLTSVADCRIFYADPPAGPSLQTHYFLRKIWCALPLPATVPVRFKAAGSFPQQFQNVRRRGKIHKNSELIHGIPG